MNWKLILSRKMVRIKCIFKYQQLYQALDSLQEKEKAAIILHYFEDLSIKEIASILQIPSGTVKYHLSTGRTRLKSLLQ